MLIFGIFIGEMKGNSMGTFSAFNDYSYFLSNDSLIKTEQSIVLNHSVQTMPDLRLNASTGIETGIIWNKKPNSINYTYTYQVLWDARRHIANAPSGNSIVYTPTKGGLMLYLDGDVSSIGFQVFIRIFREGDDLQSVDIPVCGTQYMYDNGNSICGFKWGKASAKPTDSQYYTIPIGAIEYKGKNVVMRSLTMPSFGDWENGDIVYNAGTAHSNTLWIRHNNRWIPK